MYNRAQYCIHAPDALTSIFFLQMAFQPKAKIKNGLFENGKQMD